VPVGPWVHVSISLQSGERAWGSPRTAVSPSGSGSLIGVPWHSNDGGVYEPLWSDLTAGRDLQRFILTRGPGLT